MKKNTKNKKKKENKVIRHKTASGQVITYRLDKSLKNAEPPKEKLERANAILSELAERKQPIAEGFPILKRRATKKRKK